MTQTDNPAISYRIIVMNRCRIVQMSTTPGEWETVKVDSPTEMTPGLYRLEQLPGDVVAEIQAMPRARAYVHRAASAGRAE